MLMRMRLKRAVEEVMNHHLGFEQNDCRKRRGQKPTHFVMKIQKFF